MLLPDAELFTLLSAMMLAASMEKMHVFIFRVSNHQEIGEVIHCRTHHFSSYLVILFLKECQSL
jgi:hypothetical protein